jgi:hypothetical protein
MKVILLSRSIHEIFKRKRSSSNLEMNTTIIVIVMLAALASLYTAVIILTSQAEAAFERGTRGIESACEHGAGNTHMEGRARPINQTCG